MSHSRIFQISENPITEKNLIHESNYDENFVGQIADYVQAIPYKEKDIEDLKWLQNCVEGIEIDLEARTLVVTSKEKYFEKKFETFQNIAEEISCFKIQDFINPSSHNKFQDLQEAFNEEYAFYVDDNYENIGLATLDTWVRNAEEDKPYYIGQVIDYHF